MSIFDRKRKGMIFMAKVFNEKADGPFDGDHKMFAPLDRKYVRNRLNDAMLAAGTDFLSCDAFALDDDSEYYAVYAHVKKGSKKYDVIKNLGFVEVNVENAGVD